MSCWRSLERKGAPSAPSDRRLENEKRKKKESRKGGAGEEHSQEEGSGAGIQDFHSRPLCCSE